MTDRKLVQAARLSRLGDASTGIEKQDDAATRYAYINADEIIGTAADTNVSGDSDPFTRPKLGPWLTDPELIASYDGIVASTLDRLGRSSRYIMKLRDWADDKGKTLIVISPSLQWPVAKDDIGSKIMWSLLAILAEYELDMIKRRSADTREKLIREGYLVGKAPFGFRIIKKDDHKTLAPDETLAPYVRGMADRYLAGNSLTAICEWLDSENVSPPMGGIWSPKSVSQILRNESLIGRRKNEAGKTVLRFEPILVKKDGKADITLWDQVQHKLNTNPRRRGAASNAPAMLTGVIVCAICEGVMHWRRTVTKRKDGSEYIWTGYRCDGKPRQPSTCKNMVPAAKIEAWTDAWFTGDTFGNTEIVERVPVSGHNHEDEIASVESDLSELDYDDPEFLVKQAALLAERSRLQALPAERSRTVERLTGVFVRDHWRTLDSAGKRAYLLASQTRIHARLTYQFGDKVHFPRKVLDVWMTGNPYVQIGALREMPL